MIAHADHRLLVVSESEDWRQAMSIAFENKGASTACVGAGHCRARAQAFGPTAAVVDVDGGMAFPLAPDRLEIARRNGVALREFDAALPIVLMTSMPIDGLAVLAGELKHASVALAVCVDAGKLAAQCLDAIDGLTSAPAPACKTPFGTIELSIGQATLKCDVRAGEHAATWGPCDWRARRSMDLVDREFRYFESSKEMFARLDMNTMEITGERVLQEFEEPLKFAYEFCACHLPPDSPIFHRFVLDDGDLEFVPFENISTRNRAEYLRFVYPVARRLVPRQQHAGFPGRRDGAGKHQRVLFIVSDVAGVFEVPGLKFKSQERPTLGPLEYLRKELRDVKALYRQDLRPLVLKPGADNVAKITQAFRTARFDIVHFAGHSLRADDDGRVFLALPGKRQREVVALDVEDFARLAAENAVRLVMLSSCEGCSGLALSRMASSGVPAVAGFRWPVDDEDASHFTKRFHTELRDHAPVSTAFHHALVDLKLRFPQRLTGFSPLLMMQSPAWHEFAPEQ